MLIRSNGRAAGACVFLFVSVSLPAMASAQLAGETAPPERALVDENGVNVATGAYRRTYTDLVVGSGVGALSNERIYGRPTWNDARLMLDPYPTSGGSIEVGIGGTRYHFTRSSGTFLPSSDGARLAVVNGVHIVTTTDGTRYVFDFLKRRRDTRAGSYRPTTPTHICPRSNIPTE